MSHAKPVPVPEPAIKKADVTRGHILLAAAHLFSQRGYEASTLREVARMANVKAGSVYYHFESKEQILDEVMNTGIQIIMRNVSEAVAAVPSGAPFRERLKVAIRAHLRTMLTRDNDYANAYLRIYGQLPPVIKRRSRQMRNTYGRMWYDMFRAAQDCGEIRPHVDLTLLTSFLLGGLNRSMEWFNPTRDSLDGLIETILQSTLDGVSTDRVRHHTNGH